MGNRTPARLTSQVGHKQVTVLDMYGRPQSGNSSGRETPIRQLLVRTGLIIEFGTVGGGCSAVPIGAARCPCAAMRFPGPRSFWDHPVSIAKGHQKDTDKWWSRGQWARQRGGNNTSYPQLRHLGRAGSAAWTRGMGMSSYTLHGSSEHWTTKGRHSGVPVLPFGGFGTDSAPPRRWLVPLAPSCSDLLICSPSGSTTHPHRISMSHRNRPSWSPCPILVSAPRVTVCRTEGEWGDGPGTTTAHVPPHVCSIVDDAPDAGQEWPSPEVSTAPLANLLPVCCQGTAGATNPQLNTAVQRRPRNVDNRGKANSGGHPISDCSQGGYLIQRWGGGGGQMH